MAREHQEQFNVRLPVALIKRLKVVAALQDSTQAEITKSALEKYLQDMKLPEA